MFSPVIKALPMLLLEVDLDGTILNYHGDVSSILGIPLTELRQHSLREVLPLNVEYEEIWSRTGKGEMVSFCYAKYIEGVQHWIEVRLAPLHKDRLTVVMQNITNYQQSETKLQKQLERLSALRSIDQAIASSMDLKLTLSILLSQVSQNLQIDAAAILLWTPNDQAFEYATGIGFHTNALIGSQAKLGQGYAGMAALEQKVIYIENLANHKTDVLRSPLFYEEGFVSYYCVPLVAKGQVLGLLEIFHRTQIHPTVEWLAFLEALGDQAAIAIDNAMLFNSLQRSNVELMLAYNATIEGWSRALDMRDHETEGHTRRVTELALRLAARIGVNNEALIHIRRGAILHDIGKMGIPDHILHKPGPLTDEEWDIMRQHPVYARELLSPIEYLAPAMEIPCYHHERWDGSGYPLGLHAANIPLSARLFAIVDVYDALTSNRPYRPAWSKAAAIAYIREQAGILFDPQVVEIFIQMMSEEFISMEDKEENANRPPVFHETPVDVSNC
ncbi:MAG: hypothetical protein Fur0043_02340 [Anaerolineales bacterium]